MRGRTQGALTLVERAGALPPDSLDLDPNSATYWMSLRELANVTLPQSPKLGSGDTIVPISKRVFSELNEMIHLERFLEACLVQSSHVPKSGLGPSFYPNVSGFSLGRWNS